LRANRRDVQLDSPFQLQEHLKALHNHYTRPEGSETVIPIHRDIAIQLAEPPEGVDRALWLYELCRFLTMKVNNLIVAFFAENPPCSVQTCPEMQASEWQYLCAVHDPPKTCCAIDYCCHTLDWATNILTSPKHFPSRLTLGSEASGGPQASMRHLINIFRRVYRIFAHAWYKHREVFWQVEGNEGLYIFFKTVCDVYHLMPDDSYTVPAEAEGVEPSAETPAEKPAEKLAEGLRVTILRKEDEGAKDGDAGATARRHKHSPSTGSRVATISESVEDNEDSKVGLLDVKEGIAPENETDEEGEETTIALEAPLEVTEQPGGDDIVIQEQEVNEEPKPEKTKLEEPEMTQPEEQSQPLSTEEQVEPSQPEEPQAEPETSKPEESEAASAIEEPSSKSAPEPTPEPTLEAAPEPAAEPEPKPESKLETKEETETRGKKEQPAEQDKETKSETEPELEPAKET